LHLRRAGFSPFPARRYFFTPEAVKTMEDANKLRLYIDEAIMMRDYEALAGFEDRLAMFEAPDSHGAEECFKDPPLSDGPVWLADDESL
jgi:hypothetical protein